MTVWAVLWMAAPPVMAQGVLHKFVGEAAGDRLGTVSDAGDVDGDGYADVLAGAPCADVGGLTDAGKAYVFSGRTGLLIHQFPGVAALDQFAEASCGAGDVDGDGHADLVIGADKHDANGAESGRAWVFSGATGAALISALGDSTGDRFGAAVSRAGDVDGDGFADVLIGAPSDDDGGSNAGSVRVISGRTGVALHTIHGLAAGDRFGGAVGDAGDVDADGFDDLVVGALLADVLAVDGGTASVFSGKDAALIYDRHGTGAADHFGLAVSGADDVDGDGFSDVIIGAPHYDFGGQANNGRVDVLGGPGGVLLYSQVGATQDALGGSVNGAGDVDGDGLDDLIFSAPGEVVLGQSVGGVHVIRGGAFASLMVLHGEAPGQGYGRVSGARDVNGDGYADIVIGAYGDPAAGVDAGSATVISGRCGATASYGVGCGGPSGPPVLALFGCATALGSLHLSITGAPPLASALLAVGLGAGSTPVGAGCSLLVTPLLWVAGPLPFDGGGAFAAEVHLPVGVVGSAALQAFVLESSPSPTISATGGVIAEFP